MTDSAVPAGTAKRAEPESLRARSLQASLTVKDMQKSLDWYTRVVGFHLDEKYEREGKLVAASLKAGDVRVLIGQDDGAKGWERVKGEGISFMLTTTQSVDDIAKRVKAAGGTLESEPADAWGRRAFSLRDPDGFKMVISSERSA